MEATKYGCVHVGRAPKVTPAIVDSKVERVRGIEGRADDEPFGAKRHPFAVSDHRISLCLCGGGWV
jgi:hypothetical protein